MRTETPPSSSLLNRFLIWHAECQHPCANLPHASIVCFHEPFLRACVGGVVPRRQRTGIVIALSEDQLNYNLQSLPSLCRDCTK